MTEFLALEYWGSQVPVRLLFFFLITGYTYLSKPGGLLGQPAGRAYKAGPAGTLKNGMVFTWGFVEVVMWFWIYMNVREERRVAATKMAEERARREQ